MCFVFFVFVEQRFSEDFGLLCFGSSTLRIWFYIYTKHSSVGGGNAPLVPLESHKELSLFPSGGRDFLH
jgi:hypothetical protein